MTADPPDPPADRPSLTAYLQLVRLPAVFTALADVAMGFLFAQGVFSPAGAFAALAAGSAMLYMAGMVLNDYFDRRRDAVERPERPIPSGRVTPRSALVLGVVLLAGGVVAAAAAPLLAAETAAPWRTGRIALVLAGAVLLYDVAAKNTPLGPAVMGACRSLNILMGMSLGALPAAGMGGALGFAPDQLLVAGGIGVYVAGWTWFARDEAGGSRRASLAGATAVVVAGLAILFFLPAYAAAGRLFPETNPDIWRLLLLLVSVTIVRRCLTAVYQPSPRMVQLAVQHGIHSLIVLDAVLVLAVCGPMPAVAVLALLAPTFLLGLWIRTT